MKLRELYDLIGNSTIAQDAEVELRDGELVEVDPYVYPGSDDPEPATATPEPEPAVAEVAEPTEEVEEDG